MLIRFIQLKNVEMKIGRTTSTSFIRAHYPLIYAMLFVIVVLQVPQSIDSLRSFNNQTITLSQLWSFTLSQLSIYALVCIIVYLFIHKKALKLDCRLTTLPSQR